MTLFTFRCYYVIIISFFLLFFIFVKKEKNYCCEGDGGIYNTRVGLIVKASLMNFKDLSGWCIFHSFVIFNSYYDVVVALMFKIFS